VLGYRVFVFRLFTKHRMDQHDKQIANKYKRKTVYFPTNTGIKQ